MNAIRIPALRIGAVLGLLLLSTSASFASGDSPVGQGCSPQDMENRIADCLERYKDNPLIPDAELPGYCKGMVEAVCSARQ